MEEEGGAIGFLAKQDVEFPQVLASEYDWLSECSEAKPFSVDVNGDLRYMSVLSSS